MLSVGARGVTGNDNRITNLQRVPIDSVSGQLAAACPLDGPPLAVGRFHVHEGVRIKE